MSQPTRQTSASKSWAWVISSIESAITSREISDARIPGVPCDWLSETAIVLNSSATPPASVDAVGDAGRQPSLVQVARHRLRPRRRDADDRAAEPRGVDAHRPKMRAGRRALCRSLEPGARPPPERLLRRRHAGTTQRVYAGLAPSLRTLGIARIATVSARKTAGSDPERRPTIRSRRRPARRSPGRAAGRRASRTSRRR